MLSNENTCDNLVGTNCPFIGLCFYSQSQFGTIIEGFPFTRDWVVWEGKRDSHQARSFGLCYIYLALLALSRDNWIIDWELMPNDAKVGINAVWVRAEHDHNSRCFVLTWLQSPDSESRIGYMHVCVQACAPTKFAGQTIQSNSYWLQGYCSIPPNGVPLGYTELSWLMNVLHPNTWVRIYLLLNVRKIVQLTVISHNHISIWRLKSVMINSFLAMWYMGSAASVACFAIGIGAGVERHYFVLPEVTFCLHFGHLPNRRTPLIALCTHCPQAQAIKARNKPILTSYCH